MKSIKDLEEIRRKTIEKVNQRKDRVSTRIVVGMATCGIAAGARPVLLSIMDELKNLDINDVVVAQTGCIGICRLEPIVEVMKPGEEKVTYVKVTPETAKRIVKEHVLEGNIVNELTMHIVDGKILNDYSVEE